MRFHRFIQILCLLLFLEMLACQHSRRHAGEGQQPFSGTDTAQVDVVLAGLSLEEKIGQLILWDAQIQDSLTRLSLFQKTDDGLIGGVLLRNLPVTDFAYTTDSLRRISSLPLFIASNQEIALSNQFRDLKKFPLPSSLGAVDSSNLDVFLEKKFTKECKALGINLTFGPSLKLSDTISQSFDYQAFESDTAKADARFERFFQELQDNRILAVADNFAEFNFNENDSLRRVALSRFRSKTAQGLGGLLLDNHAFGADTLAKLPASYPHSYLNRYLGFKGLMTVQVAKDEALEMKLLSGAELIVTADAEKVFDTFYRLLESGKMDVLDLDKRVRRVLLAKAWVNGGKLPVKLSILPHDSLTNKPVRFVSISEKRAPKIVKVHQPKALNLDSNIDKIACYFEDPKWGHFIGNIFESSVILARDNQEVLPFSKIYDTDYQVFSYSNSDFSKFRILFSKYANFHFFERPLPASGALSPVVYDTVQREPAAVVLLDSIDLQPGFHKPFIESVNRLAEESKVVVVNFGNPKNLRFFNENVACIQVFEKNKFTEGYAAQLLFGGVMATGKLPVTVSQNLVYGSSVQRHPVRLAFGDAEKVGIADERLVSINAIAESAIDNGVFPGCQVAIAKDGQVIFSKSFGNFTYSKDAQPVHNSDLYDIASMTKVSATTLVAMKLVQSKQLSLDGKVSDYIPVPNGSAVGNIKIKQLLLHQSGLQAQMPLSRFFSGKNVPAKGCNDYFCRKRKGDYSVKVADGLFFRRDFQDTIQKRVFNLPVMQKPQFRYSDVNFYLLKLVVEKITSKPLDEYVFENIYRPLGLRNITFRPLEKFPKSRTVPTEQDNYWRKTLVQGYVHDPCVALFGGIGGSAGIFSNAEDLAVLFQMMLNEGDYGGYHFFDKNTIEDFVTNKYTNHRGLGFDKPVKRRYPTYSPHASPKTYGHTGFTGTCVWVDPEQHLVYVFLSNRVNPSSRNGKIFTENIRSRIHEVVYSAFGSFDNSLPELETEEEIEVEEGAGG